MLEKTVLSISHHRSHRNSLVNAFFDLYLLAFALLTLSVLIYHHHHHHHHHHCYYNCYDIHFTFAIYILQVPRYYQDHYQFFQTQFAFQIYNKNHALPSLFSSTITIIITIIIAISEIMFILLQQFISFKSQDAIKIISASGRISLHFKITIRIIPYPRRSHLSSPSSLLLVYLK